VWGFAHTDLRQAYDQALVQLRIINTIQPPALPASSSPETALSDELPYLMGAVISRVENLRRDAPNIERARQLHRFLKRIRRAKDDLQVML